MVVRATWEWLKAGWRRSPIILQGATGTFIHSSGSGRITQRRHIDPTASIEDRLKAIESNLTFIDLDLKGISNEIREGNTALEDKLAKQTRALTTEIDATKNKILEGFTGNYGVLLFGIFWLVAGIIFASIAPELAKAMTGQWTSIWASL